MSEKAQAGVTVVLAEDHHLVRQGLRALLTAQRGIRIVGEASDGLEAVEKVRELQPDVVIMDVGLPRLNGLVAIPQLRQTSPRTQVIVLSMHDNKAYVAEAIRNGAMAYVMKSAPSSDLLLAIQHVTAGKRFLSQPFSEEAIADYMRATKGFPRSSLEMLTGRERQVLRLIMDGFTNAEIGGQLGISPRTVEIHRAHLMQKLGTRNQMELARFVLQHELLEPPGDSGASSGP